MSSSTTRPTRDLLTTTEASHLTGIAESTLRRQRSEGARPGQLPPIPFVRLSSRCVRYERKVLEKLVAQHRVEPTVLALGE